MESSLTYHSWSLKQSETGQKGLNPIINFHSIKFSDKCLYIWIGDGDNNLRNLSCAMKTPFDSEPTSTDLLMVNKEDSEYVNLSNDLAKKLAKRLNKQVLCGFNAKLDSLQMAPSSFGIDTNNENENKFTSLLFLIEKSIIDEIKQNPGFF